MNAKTGSGIAIGCGSVLLFLAFCTAAFFGYHVFVDRGGAISANEAMPGLLGGVCCMAIDFVMIVTGIVVFLRARSQPQ
jgi:hypothetical protein